MSAVETRLAELELELSFQERVPCQFRGRGCRRPATWLMRRKHIHCPDHFTICGHHKNYWLREVAELIAEGGGSCQCHDCETRFRSADEYASIRRL